MLTLSALNTELIKQSKWSYLTTNYSSGITSIIVKNSDIVDSTISAASGIYALLGEFGSQQSEIIQVLSVAPTTHTLTLATAGTVYAHPQDTKVTIIRYNQVQFFQTADTTFSATENPLGTIDIQAYKTNTIYQDVTNSSGYGWFRFYNSVTLKTTNQSNAIPYAGFAAGSVKEIFDSFFSILNNNERKLISNADAFKYLNEGYNRALNSLNMVNNEYGVEVKETITTVANQQEYSLPTAFSELISITNTDGKALDFIKLANIDKNNNEKNYNDTTVGYALRSNKLILSPTPTSDGDLYYIYYKKKITILSSFYDNVELPNNNFYPLIDFMLYRAYEKLTRPNPEKHLVNFNNTIQDMKVSAHKQNANLDSFDIDESAYV